MVTVLDSLYNAEDTIEKRIEAYAKEIVTEREYEFDKVEDSIFAEPDISQYTLNQMD